MSGLTSNPAGSPKITDTTPRQQQTPGESKPEEFSNFDKLAGKIVQVPKKELDAKRKEAKR
jgi:hypothetical protein